ncbi:MAG: polysaccharide deacetylase family protein [Chitinophagales bacterium]|nr:polysaccharide deacetylase family protein [Chitinophagales bacterium]
MRPYQYISILFLLFLSSGVCLYVIGLIGLGWIIGFCAVYLVLLYFAVTQIRWNYYIKSYNRGSHEKYIALTFDDGPNSQTAAILDILKEEHVPAAFFCIGKHVEANQLLAHRMNDEGHLLGNHSYYHTHSFDWMSSRKMQAEIEQCNNIIKQITGKQPAMIRPPYGITNPNLARAVKRLGMYSIGWSLRSFDTMFKDKNKLKARIINKLKGGDIVLLHDSMQVTREILTDLIREAREKGFTFVRIDKLLEVQAYA